MNLQLELDYIYNTPVFTLPSFGGSVKNIYGAVFVGKFGKWVFPAYYPVHRTVLHDLSIVVPTLTYSPEVQTYLSKIENFTGIPSTYVPTLPPYAHQLEGLEHVYRNYRAGLFYSPGLGKSRIIVDLYQLTKESMLILAPRIVLSEWRAEILKHGNERNVLVLEGTKKEKLNILATAIATPPAALITTYETATRYTSELLKVPYSIIVADESHKMKSPFSQRTKAATALAARAYRRILLSGTPALGSPFDLYGQLRFLGNCFCPENWFSYKSTFAVYASWDTDRRIPRGFRNLEILNKRVNLICIRKTKEECLDLPDQTVVDLHFDLAPEQKAAYNELVTQKLDEAGATIQTLLTTDPLSLCNRVAVEPHIIANEAILQIGKLDQIASGFVHKTTENPGICNGCAHLDTCLGKGTLPYTSDCRIVQTRPAPHVESFSKNARQELLEEKLEEILEDPSNKVIIWTRYKNEIDTIATLLRKMKVGFAQVDGTTPGKKLGYYRDRFNTDAACRVYLSQVSTGIGVTLNAGNYTIYYNIPWSLEDWEQSKDRNHRIGQTRKVTVYRFVGNHTLDESKIAALDSKTDINKLITHRAPCVSCKEYASRCVKTGTQLYDADCIYARTVVRTTSKVEEIPE